MRLMDRYRGVGKYIFVGEDCRKIRRKQLAQPYFISEKTLSRRGGLTRYQAAMAAGDACSVAIYSLIGGSRTSKRVVEVRESKRLSSLFEEHNAARMQKGETYAEEPRGLWLDHFIVSEGTEIFGLIDYKKIKGYIRDHWVLATNLLLNGSTVKQNGSGIILSPEEVWPLEFGFGEFTYGLADLDPKTGFIKRPRGKEFKIRLGDGLMHVSLGPSGDVDATQLFSKPYSRHSIRLIKLIKIENHKRETI